MASNWDERPWIKSYDPDTIKYFVSTFENKAELALYNEYAFANRDFLQNCLDYLLNSSGLLEAKSKDYTLRLLDKKKADEQRMTWQFINIGLPILLMIILAIAYQWWRKRKYTRA